MSIANSILVTPDLLPLRSIDTIAHSPAAIVAPHPDDETLGCGGAIALLRQRGCDVHVLVVSDGVMSHPNSLQFPPPRLKALRESETRTAMALLGVAADRVTFLGLPDGEVPTVESAAFHEAVQRCAEVLSAIAPQVLFLPWRQDPHPDHRASWQIADAALAQLNLTPQRLEYPIWDWDPEQRGEWGSVQGWRLEIEPVLNLKRQAIAAYRSQVTDLIQDDPTGFRLTPEMLSNFQRSWEVYLQR